MVGKDLVRGLVQPPLRILVPFMAPQRFDFKDYFTFIKHFVKKKQTNTFFEIEGKGMN